MPWAWSWSVGDHQAARVGLVPAQHPQALVGLDQHRGQPLPLQAQRGAQPLGGPGPVQRIVEGRGLGPAVGGDPLHEAVDAREVDGPHHPAVGQGVGVAVLEVGDGLVTHVADEGDGPRVGAERRARQRQAAGRGLEGAAHRLAPGPVVARVVDLVEHRQRSGRQRAQRVGAGRHLLVGGDDAVDVGGEPAARRGPAGLEVQAEPGGGVGPLELEVRGGRHHHQPATGLGRQVVHGRGQGEGRLARAGRGHGQEVGRGGGREPVEGALLPRAETDAAGHGGAPILSRRRR